MKKFKILRNVFATLAFVLSHAMCIDVALNYASMLCAIEHKGFSAPADTAFLFAIPYVIAILLCLGLAWVCNKKAK